MTCGYGTRADRIEAFYLPSYSPELNPDERLNADLKHAIGLSKSKSGSLSKERRMALGKTADADRRRYFKIARGSALECAAIQDVLVVGKALDEAESQERKNELDRMASTSATSEPVRRRRMGVRSAAVSLLPT